MWIQVSEELLTAFAEWQRLCGEFIEAEESPVNSSELAELGEYMDDAAKEVCHMLEPMLGGLVESDAGSRITQAQRNAVMAKVGDSNDEEIDAAWDLIYELVDTMGLSWPHGYDPFDPPEDD